MNLLLALPLVLLTIGPPVATIKPSMVSPLTLSVSSGPAIAAAAQSGNLTKVVLWLVGRASPYPRWFLGPLTCSPALPALQASCGGSFDSTKYPDGDYSLIVWAFDDQNRSNGSQIDVMIDNQTGLHVVPWGPTGLAIRP